MVWCVVCGVWCVVCGVWCVVCGVWCVVCVNSFWYIHTTKPYTLILCCYSCCVPEIGRLPWKLYQRGTNWIYFDILHIALQLLCTIKCANVHTTQQAHVLWCTLLHMWCTLLHTWCTLLYTWCTLQHMWCTLQNMWCTLQHMWCTLQHTWCTLQHTTRQAPENSTHQEKK